MRLAPQEIRTFFVTSSTWGRRAIFRAEPLGNLFLATLFNYRRAGKFLLHEFVVMPDHFHVIITPAAAISLERARLSPAIPPGLPQNILDCRP